MLKVIHARGTHGWTHIQVLHWPFTAYVWTFKPCVGGKACCGVLKSQCSCFLGLIEASLHLPRAVQMLKGCSLERQKKNQYFCVCDCPRQGPFNWTPTPFHFSGDQYGSLKLIFKGPVTRQEVRNSGKIAACMPSLNVTGSHQHANRMLE